MPRTALTPVQPPSLKAAISANAADFSFAAADVANGNYVVSTGRELVLVKNVNVGAQTVTVTSAAIEGRTLNITAYSLGANEHAVLGPFPTAGWQQSDGRLYLDASHADILLAVIRLP